jgi:hypothetical protein
MGLDMYLNKKTYIGANYEHRKVTGKIDIKIEGKKVNIDFNKVSEIIEQVAYWRKANHIHKWFVDNVQDGVDECQEADVSKEQLKKLYSDCKKVLDARKNKKKAKKLAEELLPPQEGFFFGDTDIDEYYYRDIEYTMDIIFKSVITADEEAGFYYRASW